MTARGCISHTRVSPARVCRNITTRPRLRMYQAQYSLLLPKALRDAAEDRLQLSHVDFDCYHRRLDDSISVPIHF